MPVPRPAADGTSGAPRLRDGVVAQILDLARVSGLKPGQALPTERELASRLRVSRNVVRQSFDILEERGLIVARRGSGRYLRDAVATDAVGAASPSELEIASITDILETREIIEVQAAVLACRRRPSAGDLLDLAARLSSWQDNVEFHVAIAAATQNFMLERLVRQQVELSADLHQREKYSDTGELDEMRSDHVAIAAAIRSRDEDAARDLMRAHLQSTRQVVDASQPTSEPP